ncbi:MAG TPA: FAD-dependent oxidoreductase [Bacteroidia bacterium]|nr:FAD-dependent oxidoreductase [Bacteroidia bacterium]
MKIAIIGTGIAGMACGHFLSQTDSFGKDKAEIFFYEKNNYAGGHTNTITVDEDGREVNIDTGFMVFNHVTYPNLIKLFAELNVPSYKTDMSFSVQYKPADLEFCGSGISGLFAQRATIFNIRHIRMLKQIGRFNDEAVKDLDNTTYAHHSIKEYIAAKGFGDDMLQRYLIPMSAAVWSTPMDKMLDFHAQTLIRFFYNHGFLGLNTQHQWYTITNGSKTYRDIIMKPFQNNLRLNDPVILVKREKGKAVVITKSGTETEYDKVIIATHGDEALALLDEPSHLEKNLLSNFKYQKNKTVLHTDASVMPKTKRAWSSWNYRMEEKDGTLHASTIYWMNSLQNISKKTNYFVSLNDPGNIDEKKILKVIDYEHPLFDLHTAKAQPDLPKLNEKGPVYFCGSYFRFGFHEDALWSAVGLCEKLK